MLWRIILWVVAVGGLVVLFLIGLFGAIYSWAKWKEERNMFRKRRPIYRD